MEDSGFDGYGDSTSSESIETSGPRSFEAFFVKKSNELTCLVVGLHIHNFKSAAEPKLPKPVPFSIFKIGFASRSCRYKFQIGSAAKNCTCNFKIGFLSPSPVTPVLRCSVIATSPVISAKLVNPRCSRMGPPPGTPGRWCNQKSQAQVIASVCGCGVSVLGGTIHTG